MSFMPSQGAVVRLADGRIGVITKTTPLGDDDRVMVGTEEEPITINQIHEIISEPEDADH